MREIPTDVKQFGLDWGSKKGKLWIAYRYNNEIVSEAYPETLEQFILTHPGSRICLERSMDSYEVQKRNATLDLADLNNVRLLGVPTRTLYNRRKPTGTTSIKSDQQDAIDLLLVLEEGRIHLVKFKRFVEPNADHVLDKIMQARRSTYAKDNKFVKAWKPYLNRLKKVLSKAERHVLGSDKMMFPLIALALDSQNRKEFDTSFCGNRWRSIISSNMFLHRLGALTSEATGIQKKAEAKRNNMARKDAMKSYRKAARHLFHVVKSM